MSYAASSSALLPPVTQWSLFFDPMDNAGWQDLREPHERLTWARSRWQTAKGITPNATAAAESLGLNQHTYRAYERSPDASKHIKMSLDNAIQFGRKFGVSWRWLIAGEGSPDDDNFTPAEMRLVGVLRQTPPERHDEVIDLVERLLKIGAA